MNNVYNYLLTDLVYYLQEGEGFDINEFTSEHDLFKFSFVRHPFQRYDDADQVVLGTFMKFFFCIGLYHVTRTRSSMHLIPKYSILKL